MENGSQKAFYPIRARLRILAPVLTHALALSLVLGPISTQPVQAASAESLLEGLQTWLDGTKDLEGRFTQTLASGAMGAGLEESGKLYIARPGRMRWEYLSPERKIALLEGSRTWLYIEEEEQLSLGRLDPEGELLPALLTGGRRLEEIFVAAIPDDREAQKGERLLLLEPREGGDGPEEILLTLSRKTSEIRRAEVLDAAGNRMTYEFHDLRRNVGLTGPLFVFTPPPGTLIVGEH